MQVVIHRCEEPSRNMWATPAEYVVLLNRSSSHRARSRRWTSWRECFSIPAMRSGWKILGTLELLKPFRALARV